MLTSFMRFVTPLFLGMSVVVGAIASLSVSAMEGCGGSPPQNDAGPMDASDDILAFDDATVADGAVDALPDSFTGCPDTPVACPDADYFITINGDGPEQTLRSNNWSPYAGKYYIPLAQYWPGGQGPPFHVVWASENRDASSAQISISPESNTCYNHDNGSMFCSAVADAMAQVTYTQGDLPGGFVAGSYSVIVANADADTLGLSGTFFACRICDAPPTP